MTALSAMPGQVQIGDHILCIAEDASVSHDLVVVLVTTSWKDNTLLGFQIRTAWEILRVSNPTQRSESEHNLFLFPLQNEEYKSRGKRFRI